MGFCTDAEYWDFLRTAPEFERMLIRSGTQLIKYWFSRLNNPARQWKLSVMDLEYRRHWVDYSKAKDLMIEYTSVPDSPWWEVDADVKARARLNCITHLLGQVPYEPVHHDALELPPRQEDHGYRRPPLEKINWIPTPY